jgi:hypothetical protein
MDERAITGAIIAAVFVGVVIIGRVAVARFSSRAISTRAATFIALLASAGLIGLAAGGALLFEQIVGQWPPARGR